MSTLTSSQKAKCHGIIHTASFAASGIGAGLAQVPCSDSVIIAPIQLAMTISLGQVFGIELTQSAAKSAIATASATTIGRAASQVLIGWIPGLGNILNAATAASVTESLGWVIANDFARQAQMNGGVA